MVSPGSNIVILTGAGISAESGVNTFRDTGGLWEGRKIEEVASPQGFADDPELVHEFYNQRREHLKEVKPNAGHDALARLEREWSGGFLLVTQNVDDLHERAGSESVVHLHGELLAARFEHCGAVLNWSRYISSGSRCRACATIGCLRPHVVWLGEYPLEMDRVTAALKTADLFVSIGTSGLVYPAAGFAEQVTRGRSCLLVEVNTEHTEASKHFNIHLTGPASIEVPKLVDAILNGSLAADLTTYGPEVWPFS